MFLFRFSSPRFLGLLRRAFRSAAALDALQGLIGGTEGGQKKSSLVFYNYPSLGGAFGSLFAHLYHTGLNLPFLILPFSSVEPFRVEDVRYGGIQNCYLLDFVGPKGFVRDLAKHIPKVMVFDHRQCTLSRISTLKNCSSNLDLRIDTQTSSVREIFKYFSEKLHEDNSSTENETLLNSDDQVRVEKMLRYIEDADLRRFELFGIKEFNIGIREVRAKLNSMTNPYLFEQLLELDADELIAKGRSFVLSRIADTNKLLMKPFKIRLGGGLYGECLAIRADGNADLSHEIAQELSKRSAAAGLRPIGAVIYMQRKNLKMCLRTTNCATDTSEIAKAYGGGGKPMSSSFIIRMDEYNKWTAAC
ncbi:hypothetical protein HPP92_025394 [Vanilla planifolia]|uniref:DHHA1 domain-containing protein n=1 Tax=Vanilla planifolia TaxID=51239 RepID=A0A835UAJ7_VANPL|nr:hypothetical protein HPP92_025394 [Vanilla planifolia]